MFKNLDKAAEAIKRELNSQEKAADLSELSSDIASAFGVDIGNRKTAAALKSNVSWSYACIDAISNEVAAVDLKLFEKKANGEIVEVEDDPILDVLYRANNFTTKFDLFYLVQNYLELAGEAPLFVAKDQFGVPTALLLLRPERLKVIPAKGNSGEEIISGYKYQVYEDGTQKEISLESDEVVFLKVPDPNSQFRGKGVIFAMQTTFNIDLKAETYNSLFFENSATPSGIFRTEQKLGSQVHSRLQTKLERNLKGLSNAHKYLILEGGLDYKPLQFSQKEMDFVNSMGYNRDKILAMFRVPKSILGITEDVNRANAEASNLVFAQRTIKPKLIRLTEQLNEFYIPLFGDNRNLFIDFVDPTPENRELTLKEATEGVSRGFITINEAREMLGLDAIPEGDALVNPFPQVSQDGTTQNSYRKVSPRVKKHTIKSTLLRTRKAHYRRKNEGDALKRMVSSEVQKALTPIIRDQLILKDKAQSLSKKKKQIKANLFKPTQKGMSTLDMKKKFQEVYVKINNDYKDELNREVQSYFGGARRRVAGRFPDEKAGVKALKPDTVLLDVDEEGKFYAQRITETQGKIVAKNSRNAFLLLQIDDQLTSRSTLVRRFLEERNQKVIKEVTEDTNKRLLKTLEEGINAGESIPQLKKRVGELFDSMTPTRSERIARTETNKAASWATEAAYQESGVVDAKEWFATLDERTGPLDEFMHGKIIALGGTFAKKGQKFTVNGVELQIDFEDIETPPLHPNCRCVLLPVIN